MFQGPRRWIFWTCLVAIAAVGLFLTVRRQTPVASAPRGLYIRIGTNGLPTILGVPLGTGSGRDITLQTLRQAHVPVTVLIPRGGGHNLAWDTNSGSTLNAIIKAGLIPTNKPSGPSPYE